LVNSELREGQEVVIVVNGDRERDGVFALAGPLGPIANPVMIPGLVLGRLIFSSDGPVDSGGSAGNPELLLAGRWVVMGGIRGKGLIGEADGALEGVESADDEVGVLEGVATRGWYRIVKLSLVVRWGTGCTMRTFDGGVTAGDAGADNEVVVVLEFTRAPGYFDGPAAAFDCSTFTRLEDPATVLCVEELLDSVLTGGRVGNGRAEDVEGERTASFWGHSSTTTEGGGLEGMCAAMGNLDHPIAPISNRDRLGPNRTGDAFAFLGNGGNG
jgi:hypothetical protein